MKQRTGVSLVQSAFGAGIFYGSLAVVISPVFAVVWYATRVTPISQSAVLVLISIPLWFAGLGALFGALTAYLYNVLVRNMAIPFAPKVKERYEQEDSATAGF
ncbi:MAG TPA: hypothetical protein VHA33_16175 [Candidatus Angelobacter sp.]|nr:hypothetical protein [Candidatus Angelobacter sp.]